MSLSDASGDDDSSIDEAPVPRKRPRTDTYGASSTTSHGSVLQESDDEPLDAQNTDNFGVNNEQQTTASFKYDQQNARSNIRLSHSSLSENCSSPTNQSDDYRPSFEDNEQDNGDTSIRGSLDAKDGTFYNNHSNSFKDIDNVVSGGYSEKSKRMMSNMGFKPGKGLGKHNHGRVEPVEASTQKGRRGLGLKPSVVGEVPKNFQWTPDEVQATAEELVSWMSPPPEEPVTCDLLEDWLQKGPKKLSIDDETNFVDAQILKGVLESKTIFDTLDDEDLRHARFRSNPYETIGSVIFLNRAAVKMANIDAVCDFMFTQPKKPNRPPSHSTTDEQGILYFADVCAGPGGFSEYVLYKRGWKAKGFGFTLKGRCDFKLSDFYAGTPETFNPYYGDNEDGNIFNPINLKSLKKHVLKYTDDSGVHFLMADGGFSVEGQENIQEILSKQLYLCQCLAALMLVRTGGHFVVKLFDVFTLFSVGLIYIMYRCFDKVCIYKPVTSRPANSERYLICMGKKLGSDSSERHLFHVNSLLWDGLEDGIDVTELVPLSVIQEDRKFYEYIYNSNCVLGERQIKNLLKIAAFSKDKSLKETTQAEMREKCLKLWQLPDKVRTQPERLTPDDTLLNVLSLMKKPPPDSNSALMFKTNILNAQPQYLTARPQLETFKNVYDWHFMILSSTKTNMDLKFFIGCGGKQVFQLEGSRWKSAVDLHITMPAKTLIYGEVVKEYRGEGNTQIYSKALHIIDAVVLGGVDISHLPLTERINQCSLFCAALEKPFDQALAIRCKRLFNMESFSQAMNNLEHRSMKRIKRAITIDTPNKNRDGMFYEVGSIVFIKEIKDPWVAEMSKKHGVKYYFRLMNRKPISEYHIPEGAALDMVTAFTSRVMWVWDSAVTVFDGQPHEGLTRAEMETFIQYNVKR